MYGVLCFLLILVAFNTLLILLPAVFFLVGLTFPGLHVFHVFPWVYLLFVVASPILTVGINYLICLHHPSGKHWYIPVLISLLGYCPIWIILFLYSSFWSFMETAGILLSPIGLGLLAYGLVMVKTRKLHHIGHLRPDNK